MACIFDTLDFKEISSRMLPCFFGLLLHYEHNCQHIISETVEYPMAPTAIIQLYVTPLQLNKYIYVNKLDKTKREDIFLINLLSFVNIHCSLT